MKQCLTLGISLNPCPTVSVMWWPTLKEKAFNNILILKTAKSPWASDKHFQAFLVNLAKHRNGGIQCLFRFIYLLLNMHINVSFSSFLASICWLCSSSGISTSELKSHHSSGSKSEFQATVPLRDWSCRENYKHYFHAFQFFTPGKSSAVFFETVKSDRLDRGFTTT